MRLLVAIWSEMERRQPQSMIWPGYEGFWVLSAQLELEKEKTRTREDIFVRYFAQPNLRVVTVGSKLLAEGSTPAIN